MMNYPERTVLGIESSSPAVQRTTPLHHHYYTAAAGTDPSYVNFTNHHGGFGHRPLPDHSCTPVLLRSNNTTPHIFRSQQQNGNNSSSNSQSNDHSLSTISAYNGNLSHNSNTTISVNSGRKGAWDQNQIRTPLVIDHNTTSTNLINISNEQHTDRKLQNCFPSSSNASSQEFLPICDALFNIISLAAYFCDIVFDVLTAYSWYNDDMGDWALVAIVFITFSVVLSQILSYTWYRQAEMMHAASGHYVDHEPLPQTSKSNCSPGILCFMHISLCGILWRYFKLFIPVDLRYVKCEVRDLCILRLVHAFCEGAPMLIIQLYLMWQKTTQDTVTDLQIVSTALSLFSVCWALASYSKNVRRQNVHKLVLTWLGVIFQFFWRLGTVTSRVAALTVYATAYHYWVFLVIGSHWFCMLMWLISPKNIFHGEKMSTMKKVSYSAIIAVVYVFCYINVQETTCRQKVAIYYVTMFLENCLLFGVWLIAVRFEDNIWYKELCTYAVFAAFFGGLVFMWLYYQYFHVKKLSYAYDTSSYRSRNSSVINSGSTVSIIGLSNTFNSPESAKVRQNGPLQRMRRTSSTYGVIIPNRKENFDLRPKLKRSDPLSHVSGQPNALVDTPVGRAGIRNQAYQKTNGHHRHHPNVSGVFNCRFNPAMKRKKKKPSSFVPPPIVAQDSDNGSPGSQLKPLHLPSRSALGGPEGEAAATPFSESLGKSNVSLCLTPGKMMHPFWKRPLSITVGSENESSVGSRVDFQQKIQEKKQQQLADLKEIEEEIKRGKLTRPHLPEQGNVREPIPCEKKQPWFGATQMQLSPRPPIIPSSDELLLDPQYLVYQSEMLGSGYYETPDWNYYESLHPSDMLHGHHHEKIMKHLRNNNNSHKNFYNQIEPHDSGQHDISEDPNPRFRENIYKSYRNPSDIESQMSLPRSYTLPREFKYKRKLRKPVKNENFLPSTNSSDGDVDSGGDDPEVYGPIGPYPIPLPSMQHVHMHSASPTKSQSPTRRVGLQGISRKQHKLHETKL